MRRLAESFIFLVALIGLLMSPALAADAPVVAIRGGQHATFSRLVFDWTRAVEVEVQAEQGGATITFNTAASFDRSLLKGRTLNPIRGVEVVSDRAVRVALDQAADHRILRDGTKVVVDFLHTEPTGAKTTEKAAPPKAAPSVATPTKAAPVIATPPKAEPAPPAPPQPAKAPAAAEPAAPMPTPIVPPKVSPATVRVAEKGIVGMSVAAEAIPGGGLRLRFPWKEPVGAAVYERGGRIWVVFSAPALLDLTGLGVGDLITEARQVQQADAAVLTLRLRRPLVPVVDQREHAWIVDLKDARDAARPASLAAVAEPHHPEGPRVIVGTAAAAQPLRLRDPEVGDEVEVVAIGKAPIGMPMTREYPQFELLPTVQGIVVMPKADGVTVQVKPDAVAILARQGLQISGAEVAKGVAPAPGDVLAPLKANPMRFRAWAGTPGAYVATRQRLQQALASATPAKIGEARLDLARFHFANGEHAEALGVLAKIGEADPRLGNDPQVRLLHAAALVEMGRYAEAEAELARPSLTGDPEAMLWRGLAALGLGDHAKAAQLLRRGENVLVHYPPLYQGSFRLAMVDAHLGQGNLASAKTALELIDPTHLNPTQQIEFTWRQAQLDLRSGDRLGARPKIERVAASDHRPLAARARFTLIEEQLAAAQIDRAKAIEGMDRLRLAWRGDDFEPTLLRRIGSLLVEEGKWRDGMDAWRQAATLFAKTPQAKQITDDLARAFETLFLAGAADDLPPIEALGIYYDFRELTPTGAKGDEMIRRLADRLAAMDLLEQAGDLIEHQVNFRLKGEARARLAIRLAILRLLDRQPEKALKALEATAGLPLPAEQMLERKLVEARALGELGRYEQARKALADESAPAAQALRAELAWRARDWAEAARLASQAVEASLAQRPKGDTATRHEVLRWATALALLGDEPALGGLRQRFTALFEGTPEAETFLVLTSRVDRTNKDYQALTREIAGVTQLEGFLADYRERIKSGHLSAVN